MSDLSLEDENEAQTGTVLIATGGGFSQSIPILQIRPANRAIFASDQREDRSMPGSLIGIEVMGNFSGGYNPDDPNALRGGVGL